MDHASLPLKAQQDLRGVKKGSRLVPLLVLAAFVVAFVSYAIQLQGTDPDLSLLTVSDSTEIPSKDSNLYVIARVSNDTTAEAADVLHFRIFDADGDQKALLLSSKEVRDSAAAPDGSVDPLISEKLDTLAALLAPYWDTEPPIPPDTLEQVIDAVTSLAGYDFQLEDWQRDLVVAGKTTAEELADTAPEILRAQLKKLWLIFLYALVPGLFGLIYRRSFGKWFGAAFVALFAINLGFETLTLGSVAPVHHNLAWVEGLLQFLAEGVVLLLLAFRLRRETATAVDRSDRRRAMLLAFFLLLLAVTVVFAFSDTFFWRSLEGAVLLLLLAWVLVTQTQVVGRAEHGKNIVLCLDGTWNEPGQRDFDHVAATNVYKLFTLCKGAASREEYLASQFKVYPGPSRNGRPDRTRSRKQIALYYQGVGNKIDNNPVSQVMGGAFGLGADAIVERAYLDVVRAYQPGDRIFIFGFSRGAAIARLVAGVIGRRGIPSWLWTLRLFGQHWMLRKSRKALDVKVDVLGCWDTVGALGISKDIFGIPFQRINLLHDLTVSLAVKRAYHMVALDETRDSFVPTLMEPDPTDPNRIVEVWFSGNHSNVGGGYVTDNLSDVALDFLLGQVSSGYARDAKQVPGDESWGLYLTAMKRATTVSDTSEFRQDDLSAEIDPNPRGSIRTSSGGIYAHGPRQLPVHAVIHDSVFARLASVVPAYAPQALFKLNQELDKKRSELAQEVDRLLQTHSLDATHSASVLEKVDRLRLKRWTEYVEELASRGHALNPAVELRNPPPAPMTT